MMSYRNEDIETSLLRMGLDKHREVANWLMLAFLPGAVLMFLALARVLSSGWALVGLILIVLGAMSSAAYEHYNTQLQCLDYQSDADTSDSIWHQSGRGTRPSLAERQARTQQEQEAERVSQRLANRRRRP